MNIAKYSLHFFFLHYLSRRKKDMHSKSNNTGKDNINIFLLMNIIKATIILLLNLSLKVSGTTERGQTFP